MKKITLHETKRGKEIFLVPESQDDLGIFKHCTDGHISVTKKLFKLQYRDIFHLHGIHCDIIPLNPKYIFHIDHLMKAIDVAEVNYPSSHAFGVLSATELRNRVINLKPDMEGYIDVPKIMNLLHEIESDKVANGVNSGLNFVRNQVKIGRETVSD